MLAGIQIHPAAQMPAHYARITQTSNTEKCPRSEGLSAGTRGSALTHPAEARPAFRALQRDARCLLLGRKL